MSEHEFLASSHHGLGMWVRNSWGLWSGSPLKYNLIRKGFYQPDDMSWFILTCYYRHITHRPLRIREQVQAQRQRNRTNGNESPYQYKPLKGGNDKSLEENAAFLNLPRVDSITGAVMDIRKTASPFSPQDSAYLDRHTQHPAGLPHYDHYQGYMGNVKSIRMYRDNEHITRWWHFEFDTLHRLKRWCDYKPDPYIDHSDDYCDIIYDTLGRIHYQVYYTDTTFADTYYIRYNIYFDHGYATYSFPQGETSEMMALPDSVIRNEYPMDNLYLLDENGRIISESDSYYYQFDSLGREVSYCSFSYRDDALLLESWLITIYDDTHHVRYQLSNYDNNVLCEYADQYGHYSRACYQDQRDKRHPRIERRRFDRKGNTIRHKNKQTGKSTRMAIQYY